MRDRVKAVANRAVELLVAGWAQKANAADIYGKVRNLTDPDAVRFCLRGATMRAAWELDGRHTDEVTGLPVYDAYGEAVQDEFLDSVMSVIASQDDPDGLYAQSIIDWNDYSLRTKDQVLEVAITARDRL